MLYYQILLILSNQKIEYSKALLQIYNFVCISISVFKNETSFTCSVTGICWLALRLIVPTSSTVFVFFFPGKKITIFEVEKLNFFSNSALSSIKIWLQIFYPQWFVVSSAIIITATTHCLCLTRRRMNIRVFSSLSTMPMLIQLQHKQYVLFFRRWWLIGH